MKGMKRVHNIRATVFSKEEENSQQIKQKLVELFPFDLEKEKIKVNETTATGFQEKRIKIFEVELSKEKTINLFLKKMLEKLSPIQKRTLAGQKESRLDNELYFFIRLDKERMFNDEWGLTDGGNCYHIRLKIAAYPSNREKALQAIDELFGKEKT